MHGYTNGSDQTLPTPELTFSPCMWQPHSAAPTQQCGFGCSSAGRLRDPSPPKNPAQPGHPVRVPGQVRSGRPPLQAGTGGPGEDLRSRPPRRGHHAQHPGLSLQVRLSLCQSHVVVKGTESSWAMTRVLSLILTQGSEQIQRGRPPAQRRSVHQGENLGQRPPCCKTDGIKTRFPVWPICVQMSHIYHQVLIGYLAWGDNNRLVPCAL